MKKFYFSEVILVINMDLWAVFEQPELIKQLESYELCGVS